MANQKPIKHSNGGLAEFASGDTIAPATLGTGTPSALNYLRGDGTRSTVSASAEVTGSATIDFGSAPGGSFATVTVSGQTGFTSSSHLEVWMQGDATADHNAYEHLIAPIVLRGGDLTTDAFTIYASTELMLTGTFTVRWAWS